MSDLSSEAEDRKVLGFLQLVGYKDGKVKVDYPIDVHNTTLGRAEDASVRPTRQRPLTAQIRIYMPDVSKLHVQITVDPDSGVVRAAVRL